jgi:hypothetical protein
MTLMIRLFSSLVLLGALMMVTPGAPVRSAPRSSGPGADHIAATGQWFLDSDSPKETMQLSFRLSRGRGHESWGSQRVPKESLEGLSLGDSGPVEFQVRRDAGIFFARGSMAPSKGAGTFELVLDPQFAATLERRGIGRPSEEQQVDLALADMSLALLDDFDRSGYEKPDVALLVRCAQHGVDRSFVTGLRELGLHLGSIEQLVQARDHGVEPRFIRGMRAAGYDHLDYPELLRARDHGADPEFVAAMRELGFSPLSLPELIEARDHGVDPGYVQGLASAGYRNLGLRRLIQARDHGVDASYLRSMKRAGFEEMTLEEAIRARDHGVDGRFAANLQHSLGRQPSLSEVIRYRDQGWTPD